MSKQWYVFFGEDWGRHHSTGQFIAQEISKDRKVLWINSLGIRSPSLNYSDLSRIVNKIREFLTNNRSQSNRSEYTTPSLFVFTPLAIPFLRYKLVRRINKLVLKYFILKQFKILGISNPIVITAGPESVDIIDHLNAKKKIYYCADKYSEMTNLDKELVTSLENEILNKVDVVMATSMALYEDIKLIHSSVYYTPHGVDYELFSQALNDTNKTALNYSKPQIGFVGLIGKHIEFEIIETISKRLPEASLIMIGPIEDGVIVPKKDNIYYLGPKDRKSLIKYLSSFDVCIAPYVVSERIRYANPTKIREYIASGCPTICTPHSEAKTVSEKVNISKDGEGFVEMILKICNSNINRKEISLTVSEQTWEKVAENVMEIAES